MKKKSSLIKDLPNVVLLVMLLVSLSTSYLLWQGYIGLQKENTDRIEDLYKLVSTLKDYKTFNDTRVKVLENMLGYEDVIIRDNGNRIYQLEQKLKKKTK